MSTSHDTGTGETRPTPDAVVRVGRTTPRPRLGDRAQAWFVAPATFDGIFSPMVRRLGVLYVLISVPLLTGMSAFVSGERAYIFFTVFLAAGAYTQPGLVAWIAVCRAPATQTTAQDRPSYQWWLAGMVLLYLTGVPMAIGLVSDSRVLTPFGVPVTVAIGVLFNAGIVRLTRSRSGQRALSVDMIEAAMAVIVIAAPCILLWGERILTADASWYTVPSGLATIGMIFGTYWALALVVRAGPNAGTLEKCGLALTVVGTMSAASQVAHGLSGFTLPAPPLVALYATTMSMTLLVALHLRRGPLPGLDRLPPQAQVRVGYLATALTLAGLPVLVVTTLVVDDHATWAPLFSLGVATVLVVLAGLRHLAGIHETRQLYVQVEQASRQRRGLLAEVMQRADEDRHRVAAQLHEQAISAYTSVVSLLGTYGPSGSNVSPLIGATHHVRNDLAHHAESLRNLMLAIQPLQADRSGTRSLAAPIHAYVDTLYGDLPTPRLTVTIADGLFLDWPTETILLRIVQEALRNVWRHSGAGVLDIAIDASDDVITVRISDDGVGFDPSAVAAASGVVGGAGGVAGTAGRGVRGLAGAGAADGARGAGGVGGAVGGSGIAAMRAFAEVLGGTVRFDSAPRQGTTVVAQLGGVATDGAAGSATGSTATRPTTDELTQRRRGADGLRRHLHVPRPRGRGRPHRR